MIETQLITLGLLFLFSIIGGLLAGRFKQPVVLGLMLIGALIGPNLLNIVSDHETIDLMIEFGAILFLFVVGLEFSLKQLMKTGVKSIVISIFKVGIMFFIGFTTIMVLGLDSTTAAFFGVALSFSSTMIIMNILKQKEMIKRKEIPTLLAVLVIEDIFGVVALTFFAAMKDAGPSGLVIGIENLILSLTILIIAYLVVSKFAERMSKWMTKHAGEEIIPFIALGLCAGFAYLAYSLNLSPSAGAFLAGSIVSTFKASKIFEHSIKPHSLMFTSFFFIAMGTIIDFNAIAQNWKIILVLFATSILGLFIAVGIITRIFSGFNSRSAVFGSLAMLPPGVFSMLVAKESMKYGVSVDVVSIISVLIFVLSITMALLLKHLVKIHDKLENHKPAGIDAGIERLSIYINTFFEELKIENTYTKKLKIKASKTMTKVGVIILSIALLSKLNSVLNLGGIYNYIIPALILIGIILLVPKIKKDFKEITTLTVKILTTLEGGAKVNTTKKIINNLKMGMVLIILGMFSPLAIYVLKGTLIYLIPAAALILLGLFFVMMAIRLLNNISMSYKYTIHNYKKIDFKNIAR